jgi:predicted transcriptional regulator of viral defense system
VATSRTFEASTYKASLSQREVAFLAGWERERRKYVTSEDLRALAGAPAARAVASALVRKGVLQRIGKGLYLVRPLRSLLRPTRPSSPFVLGVLLHSEPYYLGGRWALAHHGLTGQQVVSLLDAFVTRRRPPRTLAGARVKFHVLPRRLIEHGLTSVDIEGIPVRVSDLERTLLDLLDHPRTVGGVSRAVELFLGGLPRARLVTLVDQAIRGSRTCTCQRLGSILERRASPGPLLRRLDARVKGTRSMISMVPGPRRGRFNRRWNVVENDDALVASAAS